MSERTVTAAEQDWSQMTTEPLPCEFADMAGKLRWVDDADTACGGDGSWLLVGPEDLPSPLCGKHAAIVESRLAPLSAYGCRLETS